MSTLKNKWIIFKKHKLGYYSLIILLILIAVVMVADFIANDRPLLVKYKNNFYFPMFKDYYKASTFGAKGDINFDFTNTDMVNNIKKEGYVIFTFIPYSYSTIFTDNKSPAAPNSKHLLGTDILGRDVLAQILYSMRISILFSLLLTTASSIIGIYVGSAMGYRAGATDFILGRVIEVWNSAPLLYILLIISSLIAPSLFTILFVVLFVQWTTLIPLVRADMLKSKNLPYVEAATAIGVSKNKVIYFHILPNTLSSIVSNIPFLISGNLVALTTLDYLGLGLPAGTASIGDLLNMGVNNLHAPWIVVSSVFVFCLVLVLLIFIGDSIRKTISASS